MTDESDRPAMLWSRASLEGLHRAVETFGREVRARALDLAAARGRTLVTEEDVGGAVDWVACDLATGAITLE